MKKKLEQKKKEFLNENEKELNEFKYQTKKQLEEYKLNLVW